MRKMVFFSVMATLFFGFFSMATASIITFDDPPLPEEGYQIYGRTYEEGKFQFICYANAGTIVRSNSGVDSGLGKYDYPEIPMGPSPEGNGTPFLYSNWIEEEGIKLQHINPGETFFVTFLDLIPYRNDVHIYVSIFGDQVGKSRMIGDTLTLFPGAGRTRVYVGWENMETFYFKGDFCVDNIAINEPMPTVPIPGAVWLLGSGLISLIGFRKKRST